MRSMALRRLDKTRQRRIRPFLPQRKKAIRQDGLLLNLVPGSSLLSHGEAPHYHRRYGVSLLSSAWGQVGPPRYLRQTNSVLSTRLIPTCRFNLLSSLLIDVSSAKTSSAL